MASSSTTTEHDFFRTFDDRQSAFLYQEQTSDGAQSRFNKFVRRDS